VRAFALSQSSFFAFVCLGLHDFICAFDGGPQAFVKVRYHVCECDWARIPKNALHDNRHACFDLFEVSLTWY
jgi:hypothetical protein